MFKGLSNLAGMLKQAGKFQSRMQEMQESLGKLKVEAVTGGGMVRVEATGQQKLLRISIDPSILNASDAEMLEDLIVGAVNQALDKSREAAAEEMSKLAGEMNIPGLGEAMSKFDGSGFGGPAG